MEDYYVFVDKAAPDGDYTAEVVVKLHGDGTLEIVNHKVIK